MKKLMMVALCALGANVSMAEVIYRVPIDDLYYTLDDETLTAKVVNPATGGYSLTNVEIPECVIYEGESYAVTSIGSHAFISGSPLESVSAPFVTSIESGAFLFCSSLKSVYAPRVTSIADSAFGHCTSLALLTVYSSMKDGWDSNKGNYGIGGDFSVNPQVDFSTVPKLMPRQVAQAKWEATVTVSSTALKSGGETLDKAEYENACEFYGVEAKQEPTAEDYKFVPSGSVVVPEEQVIPEGYKAVPQNAQVVQEGEKVVPKDAQVVQEGEKVVPKDAQVVQEDEIAVKKESIAAPSAGTVKVENNTVQLGVTVLKTDDLTAEKKEWNPVKLTKADIDVDADGNIIVNVPVDSASGFMVIQTKDAAK